VSKKLAEWYQKIYKTEDTKQINFIDHQNNHHPPQHKVHHTPLIWCQRAPDQGSTVGGLLSVSLPEEHHEKRTFCRRGGNPRTRDSSSTIDS
jgi:hypothetical protein